MQNVPNPFDENTYIEYIIPNKAKTAKLFVYNLLGEELRSFNILNKGKGSITIKGSEFKAGSYLYTLVIDNKEISTKKMILTN